MNIMKINFINIKGCLCKKFHYKIISFIISKHKKHIFPFLHSIIIKYFMPHHKILLFSFHYPVQIKTPGHFSENASEELKSDEIGTENDE